LCIRGIRRLGPAIQAGHPHGNRISMSCERRCSSSSSGHYKHRQRSSLHMIGDLSEETYARSKVGGNFPQLPVGWLVVNGSNMYKLHTNCAMGTSAATAYPRPLDSPPSVRFNSCQPIHQWTIRYMFFAFAKLAQMQPCKPLLRLIK
jgi:hypothetical protein